MTALHGLQAFLPLNFRRIFVLFLQEHGTMIRQANPPKSHKLFLAFHKSIFPLKQLKHSVSQILLLSSQFPSYSFAVCERRHMYTLTESVLPSASERLHWLLRSYSTIMILEENFCFTEVSGITFIDFHKLEVHLLKLKTKFGSAAEKRSTRKKICKLYDCVGYYPLDTQRVLL